MCELKVAKNICAAIFPSRIKACVARSLGEKVAKKEHCHAIPDVGNVLYKSFCCYANFSII